MTVTGSTQDLEISGPDNLLAAEDRYRKFYRTKQEKRLENPSNIYEEINYKKEQFSKLKFQYLEQETREKFLRAILDNPPLYVEQTEIDTLIAENKEVKNDLNSKKANSERLQNDARNLAREVMALYNEYKEKAKEADEIVGDIEDIEEEILKLSQENPILASILAESEQIDNNDNNDNINDNKKYGNDIDTIQNRLNEEMNINEAKLFKLNTEVELKSELLESQERTISDLKVKLDSLEEDVLHSQQESQEITQEQLLAQWLKEMNETWANFFFSSVRMNTELLEASNQGNSPKIINNNSKNTYKVSVQEIQGKKNFDVFIYYYNHKCQILAIEGINEQELRKISNLEAAGDISKVGLILSQLIGN